MEIWRSWCSGESHLRVCNCKSQLLALYSNSTRDIRLCLKDHRERLNENILSQHPAPVTEFQIYCCNIVLCSVKYLWAGIPSTCVPYGGAYTTTSLFLAQHRVVWPSFLSSCTRTRPTQSSLSHWSLLWATMTTCLGTSH